MKYISLNKKGDISMETIVMIVVALAVLLVVIGIFTFQSRKGSGKINDIGDSASSSATEGMCMGSIKSGEKTIDMRCMSACDSAIVTNEKTADGKPKYREQADASLLKNRKCIMPEQTCCGYVLN